jgi:transposase-like protein
MKKRLPSFMFRFPTEESAIDHFIKIRYGDTLSCPHCGSVTKVYWYKKLPKLCQCKNCNDSFSPFKDTIFEKTTTDLRNWFYAIRLFLKDKKGVSALNLQRELEDDDAVKVSYKTAWRMLDKIRQVMEGDELEPFESSVKMDETYVGGKPRRHPLTKGVDLSFICPLSIFSGILTSSVSARIRVSFHILRLSTCCLSKVS